MHIGVHLGSQLMSEAIYQLLACSGYDDVVVIGKSPTKGFIPQVLLIDSTMLRQDLLAQYPDAKVLLIDTGMEPDKLCATLLSYRMHGTFAPDAGLQQVWIDNGAARPCSTTPGLSPRQGSQRDHRQGKGDHPVRLSSVEPQTDHPELTLSENTVKAHLNTIFRKFNVTRRSKLMSLAMQGPLARSA